MSLQLNERAARRCQLLVEAGDVLRVQSRQHPGGATVIDCGVRCRGGLAAGRAMAEICMADLAQVRLVPSSPDLWRGPAVWVQTDHPAAACMASQYAGWQITGSEYFAMGSGPMRAACGREELFASIGYRESPDRAVGVLEAAELPPAELCERIALDCGVPADRLTLLVARTASIAGTLQVVARSVETCLHKMHEVGFDLATVVSASGVAPLPPVAGDDLAAIGRTNDAVLYGGDVTLWVDCEAAQIDELGPGVPSGTSPDHGQPFAEIFARYQHDFYRIDPLLFSPARVTFQNLKTGQSHAFGQLFPEVIARSFA
jgi:methenyltetrahydromethanopterin cyclohydrolase